jgi:hypothetical protein
LRASLARQNSIVVPSLRDCIVAASIFLFSSLARRDVFLHILSISLRDCVAAAGAQLNRASLGGSRAYHQVAYLDSIGMVAAPVSVMLGVFICLLPPCFPVHSPPLNEQASEASTLSKLLAPRSGGLTPSCGSMSLTSARCSLLRQLELCTEEIGGHVFPTAHLSIFRSLQGACCFPAHHVGACTPCQHCSRRR